MSSLPGENAGFPIKNVGNDRKGASGMTNGTAGITDGMAGITDGMAPPPPLLFPQGFPDTNVGISAVSPDSRTLPTILSALIQP